MEQTSWWEIHFKSEVVDDLIGLAIFHGASGGLSAARDQGIIYVHDDRTLGQLKTLLENSGASAIQIMPTPQENWLESCSELWSEITIGDLKIIPKQSPAPEDRAEDGSKSKLLYVIPGTGFGTGHHPTTAKCLELLQHENVRKLSPNAALDIGCGSAILAIAISKLFPSCKVVALDNDPLALENARDNLAMNNACADILLECAELNAISGNFELIVANIYAEVLAQIESRIRQLIRPNGLLILSGIAAAKLDLVMESYVNWRVISSSESSGWCSLLLAPL